MAKTIEKTHVIPYLIDMKPEDLKHPLKQFQAAEATEQDTWKMIKTIHKASGDETRSESDLKEVFKMWWPMLQEQIEEAKKEAFETVAEKPIGLPDVKTGIDKIILLLESLSFRLTKWESHIQIPWQSALASPPQRLSDFLKGEEPITAGLLSKFLEGAAEEESKKSFAKNILEILQKEYKKEE